MIFIFMTLFFMVLMAFFSGIETGLVSLRKSRVKHGVKQKILKASILDFFISHPGYMLATTLIGTNICIVCSSNSAKAAAESLGFKGTASILILTGIMTVLLLFIEIVPKDWFRQQPYQRCMFFAYLLYASYFILYIPVKLISAFTSFFSSIVTKKTTALESSAGILREDFRILLHESEAAGIIDSEAANILDSALEFHYIQPGDIFIEHSSVIEIQSNMSVYEAIQFCRRHGKSRLPVKVTSHDTEKRRWIGIFTVYDALFDIPENLWKDTLVAECLRPLVEISEKATMNDMLMNAKSSETGILIVCSDSRDHEHLGILTISDIIKLLFG
jgi:CBS domain containing-hemolysin-like protein